MNNADLSIFVDELGDFGKYDIISPYYIIALVFHEQSISINDVTELSGKLSKEIFVFINNNIDFFNNRNEIKVYYDNGQVELSKIIYSTFNIMLKNVVSKRVMPKDYKLFQVADLFCTITNLELKIRNNNLSNSDHIILGNEKDIKKNIINKLKDKKFNK